MNLLIAVIIDAMGLPLAWYTSPWILFGLYFCPVLFVLGFGPACYLTLRKDNPIPLRFSVQIFLHGHALVLALITTVLTSVGIRSAFLPMVALFFYSISTITNLITRFYRRGRLWIIPHCLCQVLPFWFYSYLSYIFLSIFIPMQARIGPASNPEFLVAVFVAVFSILFGGFLVRFFIVFLVIYNLFSPTDPNIQLVQEDQDYFLCVCGHLFNICDRSCYSSWIPVSGTGSTSTILCPQHEQSVP